MAANGFFNQGDHLVSNQGAQGMCNTDIKNKRALVPAAAAASEVVLHHFLPRLQRCWQRLVLLSECFVLFDDKLEQRPAAPPPEAVPWLCGVQLVCDTAAHKLLLEGGGAVASRIVGSRHNLFLLELLTVSSDGQQWSL